MNTVVLDSILHLPDQIQTAFTETLNLKLPDAYRNIDNIVVCGMGGSRFPAVVLQHFLKDSLAVPFVINDDYILPRFVGENSLVIVSSYSGTTEEPIACGQEAAKRGAKIIGVSSASFPFTPSTSYTSYTFSHQFNPSGQPRMGWGYNLGALLGILINVGVHNCEPQGLASGEPLQQQIESAISHLRAMNQQEAAASLAQKILNKFPTFVTAEFLTGVGNALQNKMNEDAKAGAIFRVIPELNHHLMEGLSQPTSLKPSMPFVFFFSSLYSPPIQKRFLITKEVVEQNGIATIWHELKAPDKLSQIFELLQLGSYMTLKLSELYGVDPTVIPYVDYFKKRMRE